MSYNVAEELEIELTLTALVETDCIPAGIFVASYLFLTHVAFNNYDRFVDTFSGKDTLHDTVEIIYQFACPSNSTLSCSSISASLDSFNENFSRKKKDVRQMKFVVKLVLIAKEMV